MRTFVIAAMIALVAPGTAVAAPMCSMLAYPRTEAGVVAAERSWVAAIEERSVESLDCLLADEFQDTTWRGRVLTRAEFLADLPKHPAGRLNVGYMRVAIFGDTAITVEDITPIVSHGRPRPGPSPALAQSAADSLS